MLRQWTFLAYESTCALDAAVERFAEARSALNSSRQSIPPAEWPGTYSDADHEYELSIFRMQGASYFLISAARQLVRILDADPTLGRLPGGLHERVHEMRNVIEHWDEWTKEEFKRGRPTSAARFRDVHPDVWPFGFKFTQDGDYLVGGTISLAQLRETFTAMWLWQSHSFLSAADPEGNAQYPSPLESAGSQ